MSLINHEKLKKQIVSGELTSVDDVINESVTRTLSRTTLTSLTTFFVILTLYFFGGEIINAFAFTLLVGIVVGTYSSIFVASPVLLLFGFDIKGYRARLAEKAKREAEKEKMRAQFEQGTV